MVGHLYQQKQPKPPKEVSRERQKFDFEEEGEFNAPVEAPPAFQMKSSTGNNQPKQLRQDKPRNATVSVPRDQGARWQASYDVTVFSDRIHITLKVKFNPQAPVTPEDVEQVKQETETEFARYFDRRFIFTDDSGKRRIVTAEVIFVDSGEHLAVNLWGDLDGGDGLYNWYVWQPPNGLFIRAHELAHQLGIYDEYLLDEHLALDDSLMGRGVDDQDADIRLRHGDLLARDISDAIGQRFRASWSDTYIVREGDTLEKIATRIFRDPAKVNELRALNADRITPGGGLRPGTELKLPPRNN